MVNTVAQNDAAKQAPKKRKSSAGGRKKLTPFNKFMQTELARLKELYPDISHQDRFKMATANWKKRQEGNKA